MRPVEILLVVANLLTLLVVAVPRLHAARSLGGVVLITLSLAVVQVLLEGPRWQMVPAYVLTGLFLCVWVVQSFVPVGGIVKEILTNRLVAGCAIILAIMGLAACRRERSSGHISRSESARILHTTSRSNSMELTYRQNTVGQSVLFGLEGCRCPWPTPKIRYGSA
jgi:hypothetical protein